MCQKRRKKHLSAFKLALMHRYNDSKSTEKSAKEDWLQLPETTLTTRGSKKENKLENNKKKNNSMDISREKLAKSHTRKLGRG